MPLLVIRCMHTESSIIGLLCFFSDFFPLSVPMSYGILHLTYCSAAIQSITVISIITFITSKCKYTSSDNTVHDRKTGEDCPEERLLFVRLFHVFVFISQTSSIYLSLTGSPVTTAPKPLPNHLSKPLTQTSFNRPKPLSLKPSFLFSQTAYPKQLPKPLPCG